MPAGSTTKAPILDASGFETPSTRAAADLLAGWDKGYPLVLVVTEEEETVAKSFRNLARTVVTLPSELDVSQVVWARSLLVSESALPAVQGRAT